MLDILPKDQEMNQSALKRFALRSFLLFLAFTALVAIISVLTGSFGEVQLRILLTSLTISTASMCAMSCAAFIERKDRTILGTAGIICSVAAALVIIFGIWFEPSEDTFWKLSITLVIAAAAFAHTFLLLLPLLDMNYRWTQQVSTASILLLSFLVVFAVWLEIDATSYYRLLAVVAIVVGLVTLAIPILVKLGGRAESAKLELKLEQIEGDTYRDTKGNIYRVTEKKNE